MITKNLDVSMLVEAGPLTLERDPATGQIIGSTAGGTTTTQALDGFAEIEAHSASYLGAELFSQEITQRDELGLVYCEDELALEYSGKKICFAARKTGSAKQGSSEPPARKACLGLRRRDSSSESQIRKA